MRKTTLALLTAVAFAASNSVSAQTLTLLGSDDFTVDSGATTASYTQTATSLSFSGSQALGATLGGIFATTYDWSTVSAFGLTMSVSGTNPNMPFSVEFYNPAFDIISTYVGTTTAALSTPTIVSLDFDSFGPGAGDFSQVVGMQFTWNAAESINATIENVAVPEPTTWAMLLFGAALFGGLALRRRLAAVRR